MAVKCAQCGEELLGAVNRCWRCGTRIESRPGQTSMPPVRRAPVAPAAAMPVGSSHDGDEASARARTNGDETCEPAEKPSHEGSRGEAGASPAKAEPVVARRVGSPFAEPQAGRAKTAEGVAPGHTYVPVPQPKYPRHVSSVGGAVASLVLGILSLIASFYTAWAVIAAMVGVAMGVWGLYSTRRGPAVVGILLCCLAMALGGFHGVVAVYEYRYGYKPWDVPPPYDSLDAPGREW